MLEFLKKDYYEKKFNFINDVSNCDVVRQSNQR